MTPKLSDIYLSDIPWQENAFNEIYNFDFNRLGTLEVLLSGSVGCLREDALVETASGQVPISCIKKSDFVLTYDWTQNQFVFQQGSDAFPKGKDYLYRVISEHGEFVASGNHLIATSHGAYRRVDDVNLSSQEKYSFYRVKKDPFSDQKSLLSNVLNSWKTIASLIYHYAIHTHQYDPQLHQDLKIFLNAFPLQDDALKFGQFSYLNKHERLDDLLALALKHAHTFELNGHQSMKDFLSLLESNSEASLNFSHQEMTTLFERILLYNQQQMLSHLSSDHLKVLLFFLSKVCIALLNKVSYYPSCITNGTIHKIERLNKQEWYWDLQVPNTNNYCSSGMIHHNSAKSIFLSYMILRMGVENPGMKIGIGRKSLKDLKETLFSTILEMGEGLYKREVYNKTIMTLELLNGTTIKSFSWADSNFKKVRSYQFDAFFIEELTETEHMNHYEEIKMRVGREPNGRPKLVMSATNPDDPSHPAYNYFIMNKSDNRRVFYSKTKDNRFLAPTYIEDLERNLSPKMKRRMLDGEWLEITGGNTIYYSYDPEFNFKKQKYEINPRLPIYCSWDFNVGVGKPMSVSLSQYDKQTDTFHFFDEIVIEGIRTLDTVDELQARGYLDLNQQIIITGDATGRSNSPSSKHTNYEIIEEYIANYKTKEGKRVYYTIDLPSKNPPIRHRHETVNAYICNSKMERRLFLYEKCKTLDEGLRLTKLKANADYIEDDSKPWQHITTSLGYNVCQVAAKINYQGAPAFYKR